MLLGGVLVFALPWCFFRHRLTHAKQNTQQKSIAALEQRVGVYRWFAFALQHFCKCVFVMQRQLQKHIVVYTTHSAAVAVVPGYHVFAVAFNPVSANELFALSTAKVGDTARYAVS